MNGFQILARAGTAVGAAARCSRILAGAFLLSMLGSVGGCGGPTAAVKPLPVSGDPVREVSALDSDVEKAMRDGVDVLAPISFASAEENLREAREGMDRGEAASTVLQSVALGKAYLQRAEEGARSARTLMPQVIEARKDAREAGGVVFERDYAVAEEAFLKLMRAVEKGEVPGSSAEQERVIAAFRALEVRAIKEQTLGEVRMLMDQADREGADKIAPELYAEVTRSLDAVDTYISQHPKDKEEGRRLADSVLFEAQRLLQIVQESKMLRTMKPVDIALFIEDMLYRMSVKLSAPDFRNEPTDTQVENVMASIAVLESDRQFTADRLEELEKGFESLKREHEDAMDEETRRCDGLISEMSRRIALLEGMTREEQDAKMRLADEKRASEARLAAEKAAAERRLEEERQFSETFNEVRASFRPEEAEVYRQGNQLVIRLRAVRFPVGKSTVMPEAYPLLGKVQMAIRSFRDPSVVIEGHTDSTGPENFNEILSQKRADSVREYLLANHILPPEKISAVGFGSARPLASNETDAGRAINRRIDVVITPGGPLDNSGARSLQ